MGLGFSSLKGCVKRVCLQPMVLHGSPTSVPLLTTMPPLQATWNCHARPPLPLSQAGLLLLCQRVLRACARLRYIPQHASVSPRYRWADCAAPFGNPWDPCCHCSVPALVHARVTALLEALRLHTLSMRMGLMMMLLLGWGCAVLMGLGLGVMTEQEEVMGVMVGRMVVATLVMVVMVEVVVLAVARGWSGSQTNLQWCTITVNNPVSPASPPS